MKNKLLFITALLFFTAVNTKYFWEGKLAAKAFPVFMLLFAAYFILAGGFFSQLYFTLKEKGSNQLRILLLLFLSFVLISAFLKPGGLINFESLEGKDILIAKKEGAANCNTTFKLKENNKFVEKTYCFGVDEKRGNYVYRNDTIFFSNTNSKEVYPQFAVKRKSAAGNEELAFYRNTNDTLPNTFRIIKNELPR